MKSSSKQKRAIIIGAGPAGLSAAYHLLEHTDIQPIILEQSDAIGGISRTIVHKGNRMDIGGHRFFSKSQRVNELWQKFMPIQGAPAKDDLLLGHQKTFAPGGPDPETQDRTMLIRRRVSRIFYRKKFFDYPLSISWSTLSNMGLKRVIVAGLGYLWSLLYKQEERSLRGFYINRFGKPLYKMFFEDYTRKLWGRDPKEISSQWGAQRIKGLSLFKALLAVVYKSRRVETSLIEQFSYPKKGPGQLYEVMAENIQQRGGIIVKNAKVINVETNGHRVCAVTTMEGGTQKRYTGDEFFSTMPVKDLILAMGGGGGSPASVHTPYRRKFTLSGFYDGRPAGGQTQHPQPNHA